MNVFFVVLSGTLVFVLGQIALRLFIEPWQRCRESIARVAYVLDRYPAVYSNPGVGTRESQDVAAKEIRECVAELTYCAHGVPLYRVFVTLGALPRKTDIFAAQQQLIGLSNTVHNGSTDGLPGRLRTIKESLGISPLAE
ncbi:hypothetical protein [Roseovarius nitratireducens]|uniref:hypothetical protein n=1 Tax=Roseovarius nitratireducens TaxID=2044597 RepID=UPI00101AD4A1|nr:hypothetical protein [Roseovarius nitratireducens]